MTYGNHIDGNQANLQKDLLLGPWLDRPSMEALVSQEFGTSLQQLGEWPNLLSEPHN